MNIFHGDWGLGIGDWGLGIGPNPQSPIPNPPTPIPNPQSPSNHEFKKYFLNKLIINKKKSMKLKINIII